MLLARQPRGATKLATRLREAERAPRDSATKGMGAVALELYNTQR